MSDDSAKPEIHVRPYEDGSWAFYRSDETPKPFGEIETRAEAIKAAREFNGRKPVTVTDADGNAVGNAELPGRLRIVLLRKDGSEYGELDAAASAPGTPTQVINLTPATDSNDAESVEVTHG